MDLVVNILKQLGTDQTFVNQLVIILVVFIISKFLFIGRLQNIIESREKNTVGLDGDANKQFEEAEKLNSQFKEQIQAANKTAKSKIDDGKSEIAKGEEKRYRDAEGKVNEEVKVAKEKIQAEVQDKENEVMKEAETLSQTLVSKITKG